MSSKLAVDMIEARVKVWRFKGSKRSLQGLLQDLTDKNLVDEYKFLGSTYVTFIPHVGSVAEIRDLAKYHKVDMV